MPEFFYLEPRAQANQAVRPSPPSEGPASDLVTGLERRAHRRLHLFAPYWRYLVGLAARKGAGHEAEDIAAEAMIRAAWADGLEESTALSYLQRTVQDLAIDRRGHAAHFDQDHRRPVVVLHQPIKESRQLVARARAATAQGQREQAQNAYRAALRLWHGPALAGVDWDGRRLPRWRRSGSGHRKSVWRLSWGWVPVRSWCRG